MGLSFHVPRKPKVDHDSTSLSPAHGICGAVKDIARFDVVVDEALVAEVGQSAGDIRKNEVAGVIETTFEASRIWTGGVTPVRRSEIMAIAVFDDQS